MRSCFLNIVSTYVLRTALKKYHQHTTTFKTYKNSVLKIKTGRTLEEVYQEAPEIRLLTYTVLMNQCIERLITLKIRNLYASSNVYYPGVIGGLTMHCVQSFEGYQLKPEKLR